MEQCEGTSLFCGSSMEHTWFNIITNEIISAHTTLQAVHI